MTLQEKIGQRLMTGFSGTEIPEEFRQAVKKHKIGNVVLFEDNVRDCAQLKQLCRDIQDLIRKETGHSAFIAIDQEGGIVTRLQKDAVNVPGAMALGASGDPENAYRAGLLIGRELRSLGPNINFAPTVDVNSNPNNPVIGVRSYGDDPDLVARFTARSVQGLLDGGVMCTAKHFPGHGDTDTDSHLALPCVDKPLEELEQMELAPFRAAINAGVSAIMTTHILFPQIEPDPIPATMSRRIIQGLLREKLGFQGIVVSDCMEMKAISGHYGISEGTLAAFKAGVDLVEISHHPQWCADAAACVLEAAEAGELDLEEMESSVNRILAYKERWIERAQPCDFDFGAAREESRLMMEQTITEVSRPASGPLSLKNPLCIGCEPYQTSLVENVTDKPGNPFGTQISEELGGTCADMERNPTPEAIAALVEQAKSHGCAVVGTFNAIANPGQLELIHALARSGVSTAVVALRAPYDLRDLPKTVWGIAAYEYSPESIRAAAKVLRGELQPTGKLPVRL